MYRETNQSVIKAYFEAINIEYHKLSEIPALVIEDILHIEDRRKSGKPMRWHGDPGSYTFDYNVKKYDQNDIDQLKLHIRGALEDNGFVVKSIQISGTKQGAPNRSSGSAPTYLTVDVKIKSK